MLPHDPFFQELLMFQQMDNGDRRAGEGATTTPLWLWRWLVPSLRRHLPPTGWTWSKT